MGKYSVIQDQWHGLRTNELTAHPVEPCKEEPGGFILQEDFLFKSASDKPSLLSRPS